MRETNKREWVDALIEEVFSGKKYRRLIQKCIDNMGDQRKLYKYYSFESEFTLNNLEKSINYYNNPIAFNDPFDCNIGISIDQTIRLLFPKLLAQMWGEKLDSITEKGIETLLFGNDDTEFGEDSRETIIAQCIKQDEFAELLGKVQSGEKVDDIEILTYLINHPDVLGVLLKYYFENWHGKEVNISTDALANVIVQSTELFRETIKNTRMDLDGESLNLLEILGEKEGFLSKIIKIAKVLGTEIPDNQVKELYNQIENVIDTIRKSLGDVVGITCFSEAPDNMLMWSHYAQKHTGICVEYDFSKMFSTVPNSLLLPVEYSNRRPLLPIEKVMQCVDGKVLVDQSKMTEIIPALLKSLAVKSDIWGYEREWRHIVFVNEVPNRLVQLPIISRIIMGMNIDPENRRKIINIAKKKHIPVFCTQLKTDKYEMIISEVKVD